MTDAELAEHVQKLADDLGEHFDAVQILCSRQSEVRVTHFVSKGCGNWYARFGMCAEQAEHSRESMRRTGNEEQV